MTRRILLLSVMLAMTSVLGFSQIPFLRVDSLTQTSIVLSTTIDASKQDLTVRFTWGLRHQTQDSSPEFTYPAGSGQVTAQYTVTGLSPLVEYSVGMSVTGADVYYADAYLVTTMPSGVLGVHLLPITITDNGTGPNGPSRTTLWIGYHPEAAYCDDYELGEYFIPPLPPVGVFDVRLTDVSDDLTCFGEGLYRDFRYQAEPGVRERYKIHLQAASSVYPLKLTWPNAEGWWAGMLALRDAATGNIVHVDMKEQDSVLITRTTMKELWILSGDTLESVLPPGAITLPSPYIGQSSAELGALVNPRLEGSTAHFEWGIDTTYGTSTPDVWVGSVESHVRFNHILSGLVPGTNYHYRIVATNSQGTTMGIDRVLRTVISTDTASVVFAFVSSNNGTSDTLYLGVHPEATTCIDPELGERELDPYVENEFTDARVTAETTGSPCLGNGVAIDIHPFTSPSQSDTFTITLHASYGWYGGFEFSWPDLSTLFSGQVTLVNASGANNFAIDMKSATSTPVDYGALTKILIIARGPVIAAREPSASTLAPHSVSGTSAVLSATVRPNGYHTVSWFEWGTTSTYGSASPPQDIGSSMAPVPISALLESVLQPNTQYHFRVAAENANGRVYGPDARFTTSGTSDVPSPGDLPASFAVSQNYPNPFNPTCTILYQLPEAGHVKVRIYNVFGQCVATLLDGEESAGYRSVVFSSGGLSSGIYFYRVDAGPHHETKKMLLIK